MESQTGAGNRDNEISVWTNSMVSSEGQALMEDRAQGLTHQDVQAGSLEEGDLVRNGEGGEAGQLLGELHSLNDALGGEFTELVPEVNVQGDTLF